MKKLLSLLFVGIMFIACGGDGPDAVVKKHIEAMFKADANEAAKYVNFKSEYNKKEFIQEVNEYAKDTKADVASGKIKLISTSVASKSDNKAKVKAVLEFDGQKVSDEFTLTKIDGTWYMDKPMH